MFNVVSSNLHSVGYDPATSSMRVQFSHGGTYDYFNVSHELFNDMLCPHPWRRLGTQVKAHRFIRIS